jgi:hypothetical protein
MLSFQLKFIASYAKHCIAKTRKDKSWNVSNVKQMTFMLIWKNVIRLFRIISIPTTFRLFLVLTSEQIGRRLPVFTHYFIWIKDFNAEINSSLKLNLFSFFICGCQHHQRKTICLYVYISDIRQIVGYRTPVFIQRFPWRIHITITYNLPHLWI